MSSSFSLKDHRAYAAEHDLMFLAGSPVVYHCHHFNLFLDQTIDDALGSKDGQALRISAAHEFARDLLERAVTRVRADTPAERVQVAQQLFKAMGHGALSAQLQASGGTARGSFTHYGFTWKEKYGAVVRRRFGADAVAAGFLAAATEVAYDLAPGSILARETNCIALKHDHCDFVIEPAATPAAFGAIVGPEEHRSVAQPPVAGLFEDKIAAIAAGLRDFTAGVAGDERGLVQAFGVFVTMHMAGYYNRISYDAARAVEARAPALVGDVEELLRESGHVCVFNTFGGIMLSPEWDGMVGAPGEDPTDVIIGCVAIARALGFGHWYVHEYEPRKRLVVRASSTYESGYYNTRHGRSTRPREYFLQGAVLAFMQLAHRVQWQKKPALTQPFYDSLFKGEIPCKMEQSKSLQCGDAFSEIVVSSKG
jgi:hypothetical protein